LNQERVELLSSKYDLTESKNAEIIFPFILIGIKAKWLPIIQKSLNFLNSIGRIKFVRPIYTKLFEWNEAKQVAVDNFEKFKPFMHPITVSTIEKLLQ
jgi:leukotriene-A4 hydrolase